MGTRAGWAGSKEVPEGQAKYNFYLALIGEGWPFLLHFGRVGSSTRFCARNFIQLLVTQMRTWSDRFLRQVLLVSVDFSKPFSIRIGGSVVNFFELLCRIHVSCVRLLYIWVVVSMELKSVGF